ncbi:MAG: peptide transporter [Candidatus Omnitrophota bacterium]
MDKKENIFPQPDGFESGFNIKTLIAALFVGFIMLPAGIYMGLIAGTSLGAAAQWVTLILFVEIAKRSFIQLRRQEIYLIFIVANSLMMVGAAGIMNGGAFSSLIWEQYFVQSPYAKAFGLSTQIPLWAVPPAGSAALIQRTFLSKVWLVPILILLATQILSRVNAFTLGYYFFRVTSDFERLEFPMAPVAAEGVWALTDLSAKKDTNRWRTFVTGAMIGIIYGAFYVFIPTFTGLVMAKPFTLIPIPFVDFTSQISSIFPASVLGFMTDLGNIFIGFVLPFWVVLGTFVGSIGAQTIANPILYKNTGFLKTWQPGMGAIPTYTSTTIDFWISVGIGLGIAVLILSIISVASKMRRREKKVQTATKLPENRGDSPLVVMLGIWALSTLAYVILCHTLVPKFPLPLILFFGFILTPVLTYISARMFGITGVASGISFPYLTEGTYILSGYKGADIWYMPLPYFNHGAMTQGFKQMELLKVRFTNWYKTEFMALGIMLFCSFLFWSVIWKMGPIPSSTYPFVQRMWPMMAIPRALWVSSTVPGGATWLLDSIKGSVIGWSAAGGLVTAGILALLKVPISFFYGIVGGIPMLPHMAIPMFFGALMGKFFFARRLGVKKWQSMTPLLLAGYGCGIGLAGAASVAIALIAKTVFQLVY